MFEYYQRHYQGALDHFNGRDNELGRDQKDEHFDKDVVDTRLEELLIDEAKICESIPFTAARH
ncbi:conserved protein of unknown function, might belong to tRNA hydroxylase [Shewanella benthica]|uniref:Uncharacterized protein n=1 Tax=Shewanella benthica TaxID=43661 RepID=A0A330M1K4_9GAMM|nr:hypothetical protein [Shewanella benthica]SQH76021.1 conserved protein of unknown function, might belong to tRNA hydroxylase [Shewanella benthica]